MSLIAYDLAFLIAFTSLIVIFLYVKRHNLKRQGLLYLYRTKVGIKIIDWASKKFSKMLKPLQYVIVASGYILMVVMMGLLVKFSYFYLSSPDIARVLRVPVLTPLVPYIDKLFAPGILPPFYFTYWIIIIAIIAIPHEFAHGIFARLNKIKVHSTGFGFLGPFLAAFVEPDEKQMEKSKKFPQLAILAAGTFANVLMTVIFAIFLAMFFVLAFSPAGVYFNTYSQAIVNTSDITAINGTPLSIIDLPYLESYNSTLIDVQIGNETYYATPETLKGSLRENLPNVILFENSPAINAKLRGAIIEVNGEKITSHEQLRQVILSSSPGNTLSIKTLTRDKQIQNYSITLAERNGKAFLGIGIVPPQQSGLLSKFSVYIYRWTNPLRYNADLNGVNYQSDFGDFGIFIYDLLAWTVLISISVALVNMLPAGIFDGGRFFYLTIWGITGSKKTAVIVFKLATWLILALVAALMIKWLLIYV